MGNKSSEGYYRKVTSELVKELQAIVGSKYVIAGDMEKMADYAQDEMPDKEYKFMPDAVVKPSTAEEISAILKLANQHLVAVTPRGGGTGLTGGAVPVLGGIVLSLERMNKILEIDKDNLMAVLEPGVVTRELNEKLQPDCLFYPGYPMSHESCFIGGNVAENAGGGRAIKYGVTGRYVRGLEMVLPTGEIIKLGGKRYKDVTGFNLLKLVVGSEGTLGIFTKIIVSLLPLPQHYMTMFAAFPDMESAIKMVSVIMVKARVIPSAMEFMDKQSVEIACKYTGEKVPHPEAGAMLLVEADGSTMEQVMSEADKIADLLFAEGALEVFAAQTPAERERLWKIRRSIPGAITAYYPIQGAEDLVVPLANIPAMLAKLNEIADLFNVRIFCYGHAGDGNIHARILKKDDLSLKDWQVLLPRLLGRVYREVVCLGGTISGEHGIGSKRAPYLPLVLGAKEIFLMREIKRIFDPNLILNPGKIFYEAKF